MSTLEQSAKGKKDGDIIEFEGEKKAEQEKTTSNN